MQPMDKVDAISKTHDISYAEITDRYRGYLEDTRTLGADQKMDTELKEFVKSEEFSKAKGETRDAVIKTLAFIGLLAEYKEWKISELKSVGFDPKDPNEMMEITIDDYKPGLFSSTLR